MGFFGSTFGKIASIVNPVALGANFLAGGSDYLSAESDRRSAEGMNSVNNALQAAIADRNFKMQEDFARTGVRWRVDDALAAGLHPLAALGVMPAGSTPVSVMTNSNYSGSSRGGNAFRALSSMGQNISRAVLSTATADERMRASAEIDKLKSETDYMKAMTLESMKRTSAIGSNPPMPSPYSGVSGDVYDVPFQHRVIQGPRGRFPGYSQEGSMDMMVRPVTMFRNDLSDLAGSVMSDANALRFNLWNAMKARLRNTKRYLTTPVGERR